MRFNRRQRIGIGHGKVKKFHRLVVEKALGRLLDPKHVVHHHTDTQLVVCESNSYHLFLEHRTRIVKAGGNPNTQAICSRCRKITNLENFKKAAGKLSYYCKPCHAARVREFKWDKANGE